MRSMKNIGQSSQSTACAEQHSHSHKKDCVPDSLYGNTVFMGCLGILAFLLLDLNVQIQIQILYSPSFTTWKLSRKR